MSHDQLELPFISSKAKPCSVIVFPLDKQVGKIRDVARKLSTKQTERHVASYQCQVTTALVRKFSALDVTEDVQAAQLSMFWSAVRQETIRLSYAHSEVK